MTKTNLNYLSHIGRQKPNTLHHPEAYCPFCDVKQLEKDNSIVSRDGAKIWMENKYPVIENSYQLVMIEHDSCEMDLTNYPKPILFDVIRYAVTKWLEMLNDDRFKSVLLFKNHGKYSAGSIHHPHMQIIGLYEAEAYKNITIDSLNGEPIHKEEGFEWAFSTSPITEFYEFHIRLKDMYKLNKMALAIQSSAHYLIHHVSPNHQSFNLAFYHVNGEIIVKVFNRKPESVISFGYGLSQVPNDLKDRAMEVRTLYPFD